MGRWCNEKQEQLRHRLIDLKYGINSHARQFTIRIQPPDYACLHNRKYFYTFKLAHPQRDALIPLIRDTILQLNETPEHGLLMCNSNIQVTPSTSAPSIWPPTGHMNAVKFYTFFQDEMEFPATVPICLIPHSGPLIAANLHIRRAGTWVPLSNWLLDLPDPNLLTIRGIECSNYFWRKRSKSTFHLLDLPVELRLMIFERALGSSGSVYPLSQGCLTKCNKSCPFTPLQDFANEHITLGVSNKSRDAQKHWVRYDPMRQALGGIRKGFREEYGHMATTEIHDTIPTPEIALLLVSKQVNTEALQAGWEGTKRCFLDYWTFIAVASSRIGITTRLDCLGRIELDFTPKPWFKFFGVRIEPTIHITGSESLAHHLSSLPSTTDFRIRFRDPQDGWAADPWAKQAREGDALDSQRTTCQSVLIDWIMAFAYNHIRHMGVTLTGFVRKPQKERWERILRARRTGQRHDHNNETLLESIFSLQSYELPPACVCRIPCYCEYQCRYHYYFDNEWCQTNPKSYFDFEDGPLTDEEHEVDRSFIW